MYVTARIMSCIVLGAYLILGGCGTMLSLSETSTSNLKPDGIAVNRRANYSVNFTVPEGSKLSPLQRIHPTTNKLDGVHPNRVVTVDLRRMPFSSGKLSITLNDSQQLKKVEVTSQTGAQRAVEAAKARIDTRTETEKIEKDAEAAAAKEASENDADETPE